MEPSSTSEPPAQKGEVTFRVRGVPLDWGQTRLRSFLSNHGCVNPTIFSLALEVHGKSQTSTVTFQGFSASSTRRNDKHRWNIPFRSNSRRGLAVDDSFEGITTLYMPPQGNNHKIDIIAISGLGGHAFGSFKERGNSYMWLRDALPDDLPQARIMIFGYESKVSNSTSMQSLADLAISFNSSLSPLVDASPQRPILFIAHSLGGLIVKQALTILSKSSDESNKRLIEAVYGLIFFGVPHHGMDISSLVPMAGDGPNRHLIDTLSVHNSQILSTLHDEFQGALGMRHQAEVICFFETETSPTAKMDSSGTWKMNGERKVLVPRFSAINCRSWETGLDHICPIPRTHSNLVKFGEHDVEYDKVYDKIKKMAARARVSSKLHTVDRRPPYSIPFPENRDFVKRTNILDNLKRMLFDSTDIYQVALLGLGGTGKTQIALHLAHWVKQYKPGFSVLWLPAYSMPSFEQACTALVRMLKIQAVEEENSKESLRRYLSSEDSGSWFLLIDNLDDIGDLKGPKQGLGIYHFLPQHDQGRILFTTRSPEVAEYVAGRNMVRLAAMSPKEGTEFLKKTLNDADQLSDPEFLATLLEKLTYLPLAIAQASNYINLNEITIAEYLDVFRNTDLDKIALLSTEVLDRTYYDASQGSVATTWMISYRQIQQKDEGAISLLSFLAHIEPKAIPRALLPQLETEQKMTSAIGTLCGYGFLSKRKDQDVLDMHSLVHLMTQVWVERHELYESSRRNAIKHLTDHLPTDHWENREVWRPYLPHALRALRAKDTGAEISPLGHWVGNCLHVDGRIQEAVEMLERVVSIEETTLSETHPDRLSSQYQLATTYLSNRQVEKAIELLERVVSIQETILKENHPERLKSQHELASAYKKKGQIKEAIELLERIVSIRNLTLDEKPSYLLASQHELARAYGANGQRKEAIELLERVVWMRETTLEEDHLDRLVSQHELARLYQANGQVKVAIELLERVGAIQVRTFQEHHPFRLGLQHNLARAYKADGQIEKALELMESVVAAKARIFPEDHRSRLSSQHGLAMVCKADGQIEKALELMEVVVAAEARILPDDDPSRLKSLAALEKIRAAAGLASFTVSNIDQTNKTRGRSKFRPYILPLRSFLQKIGSKHFGKRGPNDSEAI